MARRASSRRWLKRQERDPYVERSVAEGWRSRAVYKLEEIDRRVRLIKPGMCCVDLGAAPGGWSQYAARRVGAGGRVIAIDRIAVDPIAGVELIEGDFLEPATLETLTEVLRGDAVDLVLSDMAPNISGNKAIDQPRSMALAEEALAFACDTLASGGHFLTKLFQGESFQDYVSETRERFESVRLITPKASRSGSRETYLLARNYRMV